MLKSTYDEYKKCYDWWKPQNIIKDACDFLISNLYEPYSEGRQIDKAKIKKYNLENDSINWGDLGVVRAKKIRGKEKFIILVEEASPEATNLHQYLEDWLTEWGWDIKVKTEW